MRAPDIRLFRQSDGGAVRLSLLRAELSATVESPAVSLTAELVANGHPGAVGTVEAWWKDRRLFSGRVDRQALIRSEAGERLTVECRSAGALLLDNEALPGSCVGAGLEAMAARCLQPYGFTCFCPYPSRTVSLYTVGKGQSEWEAFRGWTERAYGLAPYMKGDTVLVQSPHSPGLLILSNRGGGVTFTSLVRRDTPYHVISKIISRDSLGNYSSVVENPEAQALGVCRKRYRIPQSEFQALAVPDAEQQIRASMAKSMEVEAVLPGIVEAELGQAVSVREMGLEDYRLRVKRWTHTISSHGMTTRLVLEKGG